MDDSEAIARLEELYARLPTIECQGHCWNSCGPISMSAVERRRIRAAGVEIQEFTPERSQRWANDEPLHCSALDQFHRCTVYEVRPLICRAWGVGRGQLACPWGCTMTGTRLRHNEIMQLTMEAFRIGGWDGDEDDGDLELVQEAMRDPHVAQLMARFTNGERGLEPEMADAMRQVIRRLKEAR
jgi:Fe-S-cluster containining protein